MAILINKQIKFSNVVLESSYVRIEMTLQSSGKIMDITSKFYQNKEMYKTNCDVLNSPINTFINVLYNFSIDGDPILFAHNKYKEYLINPLVLEHIITSDTNDIDSFFIKNGNDYILSDNSYIHDGIIDGTYIVNKDEKNNENYILSGEQNNNTFSIKKIDDKYFIHQEVMKYPYLKSTDVTIVDLQ